MINDTAPPPSPPSFPSTNTTTMTLDAMEPVHTAVIDVDDSCYYDVIIVGSGPGALACLSAITETYSLDYLSDHQAQRAERYLQNGRKKNWNRTNQKNNQNHQKQQQNMNKNKNTQTPKKRVMVIDPHPNWLLGWIEQFEALNITVLRSPVLAHPDLFDTNALLAYATTQNRLHEIIDSGCTDLKLLHSLGQTQIGLWKLPTLQLFVDFCYDLIQRLPHEYIQSTVHDITKADMPQNVTAAPQVGSSSSNWYHVHCANGTVLKTNHVVLAMGSVGVPNVPSGLQGMTTTGISTNRIFHWKQLRTLDLRRDLGRNVLVIGGGLTAVQAAQKIIAGKNSPATSFTSTNTTTTTSSSCSNSSPHQVNTITTKKKKKKSRRRASKKETPSPQSLGNASSTVSGLSITGSCVGSDDMDKKNGNSDNYNDDDDDDDDVVVTLCSRRPLTERHFDLQVEWFDKRTKNKCMADYYNQSTPEQRLKMLQRSKNGGSVPAWYMRDIERLEQEPKKQLRCISGTTKLIDCTTNTMNGDSSSSPHKQQAPLCVEIRSPIKPTEDHNGCDDDSDEDVDNNNNHHHNETVSVEYYDSIVLACGLRVDCTQNELYRNLLEHYPIDLIDGYPCVDHDSRWHRNENIYIMGQLASIGIGPDSRNLMGLRRTAEYIANNMNYRTWLRDDESNVLSNPYSIFSGSSSSDDENSDTESLTGEEEDDEVVVNEYEIEEDDEEGKVVRVQMTRNKKENLKDDIDDDKTTSDESTTDSSM